MRLALILVLLAGCNDPKWDSPEARKAVCDPANPSPWAKGACEYIKS